MGEIFIKLFWDVLLVAAVVWWTGIEPRILCELDKHPAAVLQKQQEDQPVRCELVCGVRNPKSWESYHCKAVLCNAAFGKLGLFFPRRIMRGFYLSWREPEAGTHFVSTCRVSTAYISLFTLERSWELPSAGSEETRLPGLVLSRVPSSCVNTGPDSRQEGIPLVISQTQLGGVKMGTAFLEHNSAVLCKFSQAVCRVRMGKHAATNIFYCYR